MVKLISNVDVNQITCKDTFFLDTNILCAVHFQTTWHPNKIRVYSIFLQTLLMKNITIYVSALSLQELYHLVEKTEYEIYKQSNNSNISKKSYRRMTVERSRIAANLNMMHQQIKRQYTLIDDVLDVADLDSFLSKYTAHIYDPIDFALVNHHASNCPNFITDDKDFQADPNVVVYSYS